MAQGYTRGIPTDSDGTLTNNSDFLVPTQKAVKTYVATVAAGISASTSGAIGIVIDGGGNTITTGIKGYIIVPYACVLNNYSLIGDQTGSIVIDVWKIAAGTTLPAVGNSITGGNYPTLTSTTAVNNQALTSWTTVAVTAYDMFAFNVVSVATLTKASLSIRVTKS